MDIRRTTSCTSILMLDEYILYDIASQLVDTPELLSLALVHPILTEVSRRHIYRFVSLPVQRNLRNKAKCALFLRTITEDPRLSPYVRSLEVMFKEGVNEAAYCWETACLDVILARLKNLQHLNICIRGYHSHNICSNAVLPFSRIVHKRHVTRLVISPRSQVCLRSYLSHCSLLKALKITVNGPMISPTGMVSSMYTFRETLEDLQIIEKGWEKFENVIPARANFRHFPRLRRLHVPSAMFFWYAALGDVWPEESLPEALVWKAEDRSGVAVCLPPSLEELQISFADKAALFVTYGPGYLDVFTKQLSQVSIRQAYKWILELVQLPRLRTVRLLEQQRQTYLFNNQSRLVESLEPVIYEIPSEVKDVFTKAGIELDIKLRNISGRRM